MKLDNLTPAMIRNNPDALVHWADLGLLDSVPASALAYIAEDARAEAETEAEAEAEKSLLVEYDSGYDSGFDAGRNEAAHLVCSLLDRVTGRHILTPESLQDLLDEISRLTP